LVTTPLLNAAERSDKPIVAYVSPEAPDIIRHLNKSGIPAFAAPESCATALTALRHAARDAPLPSGRIATPTPALTLRSGSLNETESKALFAQFGIRPTDEAVVLTAEQAEAAARRSKSPVVVKILSRDVLHKTEIGGVAVNVAPDRVAAACKEMARRFMAAGAGKLEGFLVQEMVSEGTEMLIGFSRDEQLGASILIGLGGVTTEIFKDTSMRLVPVSERDAREMIDELKSSVLLRGFRGRPKADVGALVSAIVAFSNMVEHLGEQLVEAEINPLFVLADGQGVRAADGVVVIQSDTPTAA
jgi:acyl-CoA synthetase (NDP forming)